MIGFILALLCVVLAVQEAYTGLPGNVLGYLSLAWFFAATAFAWRRL